MTMDAQLGADGDLLDATYRALISGDELVRQRMVIRIQRHLGEWFLDLQAGIPYADWVQQKDPDLGQITARIRTEVANTPGVVSTSDFSAIHDVAQRLVRVEGNFTTVSGTTDTITTLGAGAERSNSSPWAIIFGSGSIHGSPGGIAADFAGGFRG